MDDEDDFLVIPPEVDFRGVRSDVLVFGLLGCGSVLVEVDVGAGVVSVFLCAEE
jgi:hypothetical protein